MALLERFRVLVWAGGALLGWVAGDIMATDPAVIGWLGEASAHQLHVWGGRAGAVFVVGLGMSLVRRHRPFHREEIMAAIGLLLWIAGDILIEGAVPESEELMRWLARGVIVVILMIGYSLSRSLGRVGAEKV